MEKKLSLKKIKIAKLTNSSLSNPQLANVKGGGDTNFTTTTVPVVTIGGGFVTADTRTSCYSWNGDPENPNCIGS
jgi:hypothetical protein